MTSPRPRRRRWVLWVLLTALSVLAIGVALAFVLNTSDESGKPAPLDEAGARRDVDRSCVEFATFSRLVEANASGKRVFESLDAAKKLSARASAADPIWIDLSSGLAGLDFAVRHDDPDATRVAVAVVRAACARAATSGTG